MPEGGANIMVSVNLHYQAEREEWIARLTEIAYRAIIQRGYRGSFLERELSLWAEVRRAADVRWPVDSPFADRQLPFTEAV
jgi:hypothetical protein